MISDYGVISFAFWHELSKCSELCQFMKIFLVTFGSKTAVGQSGPTKFSLCFSPAAAINPNIRQNYDKNKKLNQTTVIKIPAKNDFNYIACIVSEVTLVIYQFGYSNRLFYSNFRKCLILKRWQSWFHYTFLNCISDISTEKG